MKREWEPGDVGRLLSDGLRVMLTQHPDGGAMWIDSEGDGRGNNLVERNIRPLLVIDPRDDEQVERVAEALYGIPTLYQTKKVQSALRSMLAPPKPPEPLGLGAVVEDAEGKLWIRTATFARAPWHHPGMPGVATSSAVCPWSELDVVRKLSDGWAEEL